MPFGVDIVQSSVEACRGVPCVRLFRADLDLSALERALQKASRLGRRYSNLKSHIGMHDLRGCCPEQEEPCYGSAGLAGKALLSMNPCRALSTEATRPGARAAITRSGLSDFDSELRLPRDERPLGIPLPRPPCSEPNLPKQGHPDLGNSPITVANTFSWFLPV